MKNRLFFLGIVTGLCLGSCSNDDRASFDAVITTDMFSFKSVEGGAVLQYKLSDPRINKVKAEYQDEFGEPIYKVGDYSVDTLLLDGFNSEHSSVPVKVSFLDRNGNETETTILNFNTLASNLYAFFDKVQVSPYWQGFQVTYELSGLTNGSATIYFVGENPNTHSRDTLTVENFQLEAGKYTKAYTLDASQQQSSYTVVITTEDSKQRIARKEVWTDIVGIEREMLPNQDFELLDPFDKSKEIAMDLNDSWQPGALGKQYLFDGDTKGIRAASHYRLGRATPPFTFLAGPDALHSAMNDVYFVLDVKQPAMIGEMRFYAKYGDTYATNRDFDNDYYSKLPCSINVYAWTASTPYDSDMNQSEIPASNWKLMGSYNQDPNVTLADRWYCGEGKKELDKVKTLAELNALPALYASIPFEFDEQKYRYYKIEFETTYIDPYAPDYHHNNSNQVTCHEIEVYAKKEQ